MGKNWTKIFLIFAFLAFLLFLKLSIIDFLLPHDVTTFNYDSFSTAPFCSDKSNVTRQKFITTPLRTISKRIGMGNKLFEVLSLISMAIQYNRTAIYNSEDRILMEEIQDFFRLHPRLRNELKPMRIETKNAVRYPLLNSCCHYQHFNILSCDQTETVIFDGIFFQSFKYFDKQREFVRSLLKPNEDQRAKVVTKIRRDLLPEFKICVHIRRGDFLVTGIHEASDRNFVLKAVEFLRQKYGKTIIFLSDDGDWIRQNVFRFLNFQNFIQIIETPTDQPMEDLHFSAIFCDSVLITAPSSTFGWWLGYLSKNIRNVYYRDIQETKDRVQYQMIESDFYLPEWKKLKTSSNGQLISLDL